MHQRRCHVPCPSPGNREQIKRIDVRSHTAISSVLSEEEGHVGKPVLRQRLGCAARRRPPAAGGTRGLCPHGRGCDSSRGPSHGWAGEYLVCARGVVGVQGSQVRAGRGGPETRHFSSSSAHSWDTFVPYQYFFIYLFIRIKRAIWIYSNSYFY